MFASLTGQISEIFSQEIIIEISGIGYLVQIAKNKISQLKLNQLIKLKIQTRLKPDNIVLFGFANSFEYNFFNQLSNISGISDRLACNISGLFSPVELLEYCNQNQTKLNIKIDGVGPKTWEKIVFHLQRNKNLHQMCLEFIGQNNNSSVIQNINENCAEKDEQKIKIEQAVSGLVSIGILRSEGIKLVELVISENEKISLEDLIRQALVNYKKN